MRTWRKQFAHLDEEQVTAELREWFREPRSNADVREHVGAYEGVAAEPWAPVIFARTLVPLIQLPPAGHWDDSRRAAFVADPRPLPDPADAATLVLERYLAAFGPASRRDAAAWAGVAQRDFAAAWERLETVEYGERPARPAGRAAPARRHAAAPALPRALGPGAARLRRPRADHPAGAAPAGGDGQRRADVHGRRPRRRHVERPRGRPGGHAAGRALARAAGRGEGGGAADRAVLRRERPVEREKPPRGRLVCTYIGSSPAELEPGLTSWRVAAHRRRSVRCRMSLWPKLADLPLVVEGYELDTLSAEMANGQTRTTILVRIHGGGHEGLGEDVGVMPDDEDPCREGAGPVARGRVDARVASATTWGPSSSGRSRRSGSSSRLWRNWSFESAALDLALRQAGRPLHEVLEREPRPLRFVNSLGLGDPPSTDTIHRRLARYPDVHFKLDAAAAWDLALCQDLAATDAVEVVDFKGQYGMEVEDEEALAAMYRHVVATLPRRDPRGPARPARGPGGDRAARRPRLLRRADHPGRRPRHDAGQADPRRQHQALPHRQPARAARALRTLRGRRPAHVQRRDGRAGRRARPDPAARVDLPPGRAERRGAERVQRARPAGGAADEPAAARRRRQRASAGRL